MIKFVGSFETVKSLPNTHFAEYAFIGRSNVGKSSLINMLCHNPKLAKTSQKPGKTLLINHFEVTTTPPRFVLRTTTGRPIEQSSSPAQGREEDSVSGT